MKHLKTYTKLFESKFLNPVEDLLLPLYDLGFEPPSTMDIAVPEPGYMKISMKIQNSNDDFLLEVFGEYLALIDRLKSDFTLLNHGITFSGTSITITFKREVTDPLQEIEMEPAQKIAYESISKCIGERESLKLGEMTPHFIKFDKHKGNSYSSFISIGSDGKVKLPILRGSKSRELTELPFTEEDINWFKRMLWLDSGNLVFNTEEFNLINSKSQKELREIYK